MMKSLAELEAIRNKTKDIINLRKDQDGGIRIVVGMATCGIAAGARPVMNALVSEVAKRGLSNVTVSQTGCIGMCRLEPMIEVYEAGKEKVTYVKMTEEKAIRVINEHIVNKNVVSEFVIGAADK